MSKIRYTLDNAAESDAFIEAFGEQLSDAQLDSLDNFRDHTESALPDGNDVDPRKDPVTARRVLLEPLSTLAVSEAPFVLPLLPYLKRAGAAVPAEVAVLSKQHDFYLLRFGLDASPRGKERFTAVRVCFDFPTGNLTYAMNPDTDLEQRFVARGNVEVGLDLNATFAVKDVEIAGVAGAGAEAAAKAQAKLISSWEYAPVRAKLVATGLSSSFAAWSFERTERMIGHVPLAVVLAAQKGLDRLSIDVRGSYELSRGLWWWKRESRGTIPQGESILVRLSVS